MTLVVCHGPMLDPSHSFLARKETFFLSYGGTCCALQSGSCRSRFVESGKGIPRWGQCQERWSSVAGSSLGDPCLQRFVSWVVGLLLGRRSCRRSVVLSPVRGSYACGHVHLALHHNGFNISQFSPQSAGTGSRVARDLRNSVSVGELWEP